MSRIAIIPARSGSKGLKDKNIKILNGKPLMAYTIECAIESNAFDKIFVSTDSQVYADIAEKFGADASFLRSESNSTDNANSWDAVREVIAKFEALNVFFDEIMLLQATSPLRNATDIKNAIDIFYQKKANAVVSVTECNHSPIWCNTLPQDGNMDNFEREEYRDLPRQKLPTFYRYNGAIYMLKREELLKRVLFNDRCFAYIMNREKSIDIDTELDFKIAEFILERMK